MIDCAAKMVSRSCLSRVIRDRVELAASWGHVRSPLIATQFCSPAKCREVPTTDIRRTRVQDRESANYRLASVFQYIPNNRRYHEINNDRADRPARGAKLMRPRRQNNKEVSEAGEHVRGE
jgi:hypothetical protein